MAGDATQPMIMLKKYVTTSGFDYLKKKLV